MNTYSRYGVLILTIIVSIHVILTFTREPYGRATSISNIVSSFRGPSSESYDINIIHPDQRANATFFILCRNSDLHGAMKSVREIESRFNRKYRYPYVFLNDEPFTDEFKESIAMLTPSLIEFGLIPEDHWSQPDWIDEEKATIGRNTLEKKGVIYADSVPYRNMCRFNSGFFFRHPLMQKYRWYWRIELGETVLITFVTETFGRPNVHFHCDINYDPFVFMETHNKTYSFTITMYEFEATIPTLWGHVMDFVKDHPEYIDKDNALGFMSSDHGTTYNLCHFWSNFEIADLDFWRSEPYMKFFDYLESQGGFYYERWGDAPVHSIAASLFRSKDQIHFFNDIGYEHHPFTHCPLDKKTWRDGKCSCSRRKSFDYDNYSCMSKWDRFMKEQ